MNIWHQVPILRILLFFVAGIVTALSFNASNYLQEIMYLPAILLFTAYLLWPDKIITYPTRWIIGAIIGILFFALGYDASISRDPASEINYFNRLLPNENTAIVKVRVIEPPQVKPKQVKLKIKVEKIYFNDSKKLHCYATSGFAICYLKNEKNAAALKYCDQLFLKTAFTTPPPAIFPKAFDYRRYLKFKHIYHVTHCKSDNWKICGHDNSHPIFELAYHWQEKLAGIFKTNGLKDEEYSVGAAMLLGKYENFSQELRNAYASAGVTHILSVSGLHVGIVFIVFNHLLSFLNRNKKLKIIKAVLIILLTWFYALLTGLSPPVQRAAAMFTFLIAGKARNRNSNILNTLSASALLLLIIDPYLIADVGFQLSYLAVIGIVIAGNPLYQLFTPNQYVIDKLWQMIAISIGAQLITGPLAVYYFNQFPTYFIPANMLIIPLSTLVMYLGMAVLVTSPVTIISTWLTKIFSWSIEFMNYLINLFDQLPAASLKGLYINLFEMLLLFMTGILISIYINYKKKWQILILAALSCVFYLSINFRSLLNNNMHSFSVLSSQKGCAICFIDHFNQIILADSLAFTGKDFLQAQTTTYAIANGVKSHEIKPITNACVHPDKLNGLLIHHHFSKRFIVLGPDFHPVKKVLHPLKTDFLILSGHINCSPEMIFKFINPKQVILCASIKIWKSKKLKAYCIRNNIPVFNIAENGAFVREESSLLEL
jgi:competence protein ComEC